MLHRYGGEMRQGARGLDPGLLLVGLVTLLCIAVGAPAMVLHARGLDVTYGPSWLWPVTYVAFVASYLSASILTDHPRRAWSISFFLLQEALAVASVLLIHTGLGFVSTILVFSAALSCYVVPRWGSAIIIAVNTVVVVIGASGLAEQATSGLFYLAVQTVSVGTVMIWIAQERSQRQLAATHVELAATAALLEQSARAEERLRISRDLHDVAGHQLTALALELEITTHHVRGPAEEHVTQAKGIAKDLLENVRGTVSQLRDDRGSLHDALHHAVAGITRPAVTLNVDPDLTVDAERRTALVRAAQEIVTNAIRHADSARRLRIDITRNLADGSLLLEAHDDGWARRDYTLGNGLRGLRERAEQLGGGAEFSRSPDGGFQVRMAVPAT